jgi:hypothetical protein
MIMPAESALVQTVEDNLRTFTKRELLQAKKARELMVRMGFPSVQQAIRTANSGSNFDVTPRDFEIADTIWGKDIASLKGKTKKRAAAIADIRVIPTLVQKEQVLSVDIMFVRKLAILIGVSTPLDLTLATSLTSLDMQKPSRAADTVRRGIQYFLGVLQSQGFEAKLIMSDGEGAVAKLKTELNLLGVEVDTSGAGGHVARVERRIQVVKERMRTHIHHLPFALSQLALSMLALYCVSRLNYEPSSIRDWGASPRELFLGRKADAKRDFRCAFGDYVQSTVAETDNSMKARTEDCIALLPTGNRTGSVRMLSLATGKIVTRDQFRILPMSISVIQLLNRMAAADGITPQTTTGVPPDTIRDHPTAASQLPTYFTPSHHTTDDPTFTMNATGAGEIELADEIGMSPPTHTITCPTGRLDTVRWGVYHVTTTLTTPPDPIDTNTHEDTGNEHHDSNSDGIRGDIRGADYMEESAGGAEHHDSGLGNDDGDHHQIRGEGGAVTADMGEQESDPSAGRSDVQRPGARLLDYFRRGGTDLAMVNRELMSEQAMNITVREAIRTRGEEAERVILKELAQMIN